MIRVITAIAAVAGAFALFISINAFLQAEPAPSDHPAVATRHTKPAERSKQRIEYGEVRWRKDYDAAVAESKETGKPMFVLFQEVPGCMTCQLFGRDVLSHLLLVEAIESEFIPVVIHNNKPGKDAELLKRFGEPSWNNPVVRFMNADAEDIVPRKAGVYGPHDIASRMAKALEKHDRKIPDYLKIVVEENNPNLKRATFAMFCFWTGEAKLGAIEGVTTTRAGWLDGKEVVELYYDPQRIKYKKLVESAQSMQCASTVFAEDAKQLATARQTAGNRAKLNKNTARDAKTSDQSYALRRNIMQYLPLTPMQRTKLNAAVASNDHDFDQWLSPRQHQLLERLSSVRTNNFDQLKTLQPPTDIRELIAYETALDKRLNEIAGSSEQK